MLFDSDVCENNLKNMQTNMDTKLINVPGLVVRRTK